MENKKLTKNEYLESLDPDNLNLEKSDLINFCHGCIAEWKKNEVILQFGIISMYDPIRGENITIGADNGPSFLMPSFNVKVNYGK